MKNMERPDVPPVRHPIVLFDGVCNWCAFWVQFLIKRDRRRTFRFAALQSDPGQQLLKAAGLPSDQLDTMVLIDGDKYYVKSSAVLQIMKKMDRLWPFLFVFIVIPPFIRDYCYDLGGTIGIACWADGPHASSAQRSLTTCFWNRDRHHSMLRCSLI